MPVTTSGRSRVSQFCLSESHTCPVIVMVLPTTDASPKYFLAVVWDRTMDSRLGKNARRTALHQWQSDHLKEPRIDDVHLFQKLMVPGNDRHGLRNQAGHGLDLGDLLQHRLRHRKRDLRSPVRALIGIVDRTLDAIEVLAARNPFVIGNFIANEQNDEDGASQPHRQTGDIDEAVKLVPDDIAQGDREIIPEHGGLYSVRRA